MFRCGATVVCGEQVKKIEDQLRENRRFTISKFSDSFPQIARLVLHEAITLTIAYLDSGGLLNFFRTTQDTKSMR